MSELINLMESAVANAAKNNSSLDPIEKERLSDYISLQVKSATTFVNVLKCMPDVDRRKLGQRIATTQIVPNKSFGIMYYKEYKAGLSGAAAQQEQLCLESLVHANTQYAELLSTLQRELPNLFQNKVINMYNTKMSHVMVFAMIREAELVSDFSMFLLNLITHDITHETMLPPGYRKEFIKTHMSRIVAAVNRIANSRGGASYLNGINDLKQNNADVLVMSATMTANTQFVDSSKLSDHSTKLLTSGFFPLNIPRIIGEAWNNVKNWYYAMKEQDNDWMEAHVTLLRLELQDNKDPNSEEYLHLKNVIERYDEMISTNAAKIEAYYNSY